MKQAKPPREGAGGDVPQAPRPQGASPEAPDPTQEGHAQIKKYSFSLKKVRICKYERFVVHWGLLLYCH